MTFEVCGALVQQPFDLNISAGCTSLHACDWESEQLRTSISTKRQTVFASGRCWIRWKLFLLCIIIWCNVNLGLLLQYYYYHLINLICCLMLLFEFNFKSFPPRRGYEFNFSKVSRQDEGSTSTFLKFPAKTRVRIQLFKSFPPRRGKVQGSRFNHDHERW
jgi:hypothetical protein